MIEISQVYGKIKKQSELLTNNVFSDSYLDSTVGNTILNGRRNYVRYFDATLNQNPKTANDIIEFIENSSVIIGGTLATTQISTTPYFSFTFDGAANYIQTSIDDLNSLSVQLCILPTSVTTVNLPIFELQGSSENLLVKHVDDKLQVLSGGYLIAEFSTSIDVSNYTFINLSIASDGSDSYLGFSIGRSTAFETTVFDNVFKLANPLPVITQTYNQITVGSESIPTTFFAGEMSLISVLDGSVDTSKAINIFSGNKVELDDLSLLATDTKVNSPLTDNLARVGFVDPNVPDTVTFGAAAFDYSYNVPEIPNYWNLDNRGRQNILAKYQTFTNNGGLPFLWYEGELSNNRNLLTVTETLSTQTVTLPVGDFTLWFTSGAGSITLSNNTGITNKNNESITAGKTNKLEFSVLVAGDFDFTVVGTVEKAQLQSGIELDNTTDLVYQRRTGATAANLINFGTAGAAGDGVYANGSTNDMLVFDTENGLVQTFNQAAIQQMNTTAQSVEQFTYQARIKTDWTVGVSQTIIGFNGSQSMAFSTQATTGIIRLLDAAGTVLTSTNIIPINEWVDVAVTFDYNAGTPTAQFYIDGEDAGSDTATPVGFTARNYEIGEFAGQPFNGLIDHIYVNHNLLTQSEIQNRI